MVEGYEGQEENIQGEVTLEQIKKECLDSPGYIMFVGCISKNRDSQGNNMIDFKYRRYHFSFEDSIKAVEEFKKQVNRDIHETIEDE